MARSRKKHLGFAVLNDHGGMVCEFWSNADALAREAARQRLSTLPEGAYWLFTIRDDRAHLRRMAIDGGTKMFMTMTHVAVPRPYPLSDQVRKVIARLRRDLLASLKVPRQVAGYYLRLVADQ